MKAIATGSVIDEINPVYLSNVVLPPDDPDLSQQAYEAWDEMANARASEINAVTLLQSWIEETAGARLFVA